MRSSTFRTLITVVDLTAAKGAGILGAIIKPHRGLHSKILPTWPTGRRRVNAGLLWGAYHFARERRSEPGRFFLNTRSPLTAICSSRFEANVQAQITLEEAARFVTTSKRLQPIPGLYAGAC